MRKSGIALALAGALALAACGSGGDGSQSVSKTTIPVSRKLVLASVDATTAAKTARIDMTTEMSGFDDNTFKMNGEGEIDFDSGDSRVTMYIDRAAGLGLGLDDGFEMRTVDGVVYMRMPSVLGEMPGVSGDKEWLAIDTSMRGGGSANFAPLGMTGQSDPTKALAYLQKVSDDVREVGTEEIRGVETTHYRATIDLSKSIDESEAPEGLRDTMKEFAGMFGDIPADIWIDGDGRMRRERIEINFGDVFDRMPGGGKSAVGDYKMTQTLDLYDFGTPVEVEAPPADQVESLGAGNLPTSKGFGEAA